MRVTLPRVIYAEWTKFRALRSTWIVLAATTLIVIGLAAGGGWALDADADERGRPPTTGEAASNAFFAIDLLSMVIGVFGILMMTGEYGSGLIRATFAAVPKRLPVLWAKAAVLVAVSTPVMLVACLGGLLATNLYLGAEGASIGDPGVLRATLGAAAAPVALGLIGLGTGALMRHSAGAITLLVGVALVLPPLLVVALPATVEDALVPYLPTTASQAVYTLDDSNPFEMLSPGAGALVLTLWVIGILGFSGVMLHRRDA